MKLTITGFAGSIDINDKAIKDSKKDKFIKDLKACLASTGIPEDKLSDALGKLWDTVNKVKPKEEEK